MTIKLNDCEAIQIRRTKQSERNNGGFQSLMVSLSRRIAPDGQLDLTPEDVERIGRYARYDEGGYEGRLREAFGRHLPQFFTNVTRNLFD